MLNNMQMKNRADGLTCNPLRSTTLFVMEPKMPIG
jgi:hypothetical protein